MLTVIICLALVGVLVRWFWDSDGFASSVVALLCTAMLVFALVFPAVFGGVMARRQAEPSVVYKVEQIDGRWFYFNDGKWHDVLSVRNQEQSDVLRVTWRKAPSSLWYWPMGFIRAEIPIVAAK